MNGKTDGQSLAMHLPYHLEPTCQCVWLDIRTEIYCRALPLVPNDLIISPFPESRYQFARLKRRGLGVSCYCYFFLILLFPVIL
ncbi:hypothetical protein BDV11DRAFT_183275, partial [Aspergillus similis]